MAILTQSQAHLFLVFCHPTTQTYLCHELKSIEYVSHIEYPTRGADVFLADYLYLAAPSPSEQALWRSTCSSFPDLDLTTSDDNEAVVSIVSGGATGILELSPKLHYYPSRVAQSLRLDSHQIKTARIYCIFSVNDLVVFL